MKVIKREKIQTEKKLTIKGVRIKEIQCFGARSALFLAILDLVKYPGKWRPEKKKIMRFLNKDLTL